jgi:hypothetical protein
MMMTDLMKRWTKRFHPNAYVTSNGRDPDTNLVVVIHNSRLTIVWEALKPKEAREFAYALIRAADYMDQVEISQNTDIIREDGCSAQ